MESSLCIEGNSPLQLPASGLELICNLNLPAFPIEKLIQGADDSGKRRRDPLQQRWAVVSEPSLTHLLGF